MSPEEWTACLNNGSFIWPHSEVQWVTRAPRSRAPGRCHEVMQSSAPARPWNRMLWTSHQPENGAKLLQSLQIPQPSPPCPRIPEDKNTSGYLLAGRAIPSPSMSEYSRQCLLPTARELLTDAKSSSCSHVLCLQPSPFPSRPRWPNKPAHHLHQHWGTHWAPRASQTLLTPCSISLTFTAQVQLASC